MIKILVVDDQLIFRNGLMLLLGMDKTVEVVGSANDGIEAIEYLENNQIVDVVIMDINMPNLNGIDATKIISERFPEVKVLMLTMYENESTLRKSLYAGAKGYITKDTDLNELQNAIFSVNEGKTFLCSSASQLLIDKLRNEEKVVNREVSKTAKDDEGVILTQRELSILKLICEGKTSLEISDDLMLSQRTVDVHRHNIMKKTKTVNIAQLIVYAIKNGYFKIE